MSSTEFVAGSMCWSRRGGASDDRVDKNDTGAVDSAESLWWPCILYPTWAHAATRSGFMPKVDPDSSNESSSKQWKDEGILIQGCRKPISVKHLAKNMVPLKAALRYQDNNSPSKTPKKRKAVAYYLGLDAKKSKVPNWAAVPIERLRPYRADAMEVLRSYREKIHRDDWQELLLAVEEAAFALGDDHFKPKALLQRMEDSEEHRDEAGKTPEFFDDWKSGGSQTQSQRMTQFSQARTFRMDGTAETNARESAVAKEIIAGGCDGETTPERPSKTAEETGNHPVAKRKHDTPGEATVRTCTRNEPPSSGGRPPNVFLSATEENTAYQTSKLLTWKVKTAAPSGVPAVVTPYESSQSKRRKNAGTMISTDQIANFCIPKNFPPSPNKAVTAEDGDREKRWPDEEEKDRVITQECDSNL